MTEQEALARMVAPGTRRPGKYREGVIQIWVTRACDKQCYGCTQGSNLSGNPGMITIEQFEQAVVSLKGYFGVVGVFGGNPAMHPQFGDLCAVLRQHIPWEQRGLWCNNPITQAKAESMRATFNPNVSNINVHMDQDAFALFHRYWPEARPVGLYKDSRHSPCYVAMKDVLKKPCGCAMDDTCSRCNNTRQVYDEGKAWELISRCDINQHWSAMIGVFRGEVRAWFCEIAGAQAMLHQHEPEYPDTGMEPRLESNHLVPWTGRRVKWWELPMYCFADQVRKHCHECSVPLKGYGELAQAPNQTKCQTCDGHGKTHDAYPGGWSKCDSCGGSGFTIPQEQVSETHKAVFKPKDKGRRVELVTVPAQLQQGRLERMTDYLGNVNK